MRSLRLTFIFNLKVNNLHSSVHMSNLLHGVIKMDVSNSQGRHATCDMHAYSMKSEAKCHLGTEKQATLTIMSNFLTLHQLIVVTYEYGYDLPRSQMMLPIGAVTSRKRLSPTEN